MTALSAKLRKLAAELIAAADAIQKTHTVEPLGDWQFHRANGTIAKGKKVHLLTRSQAAILTALLDNRGACLSRDLLTSLLFGSDAVNVDSRTIDTHVANLRHKLGADIIRTIHGRGYLIP